MGTESKTHLESRRVQQGVSGFEVPLHRAGYTLARHAARDFLVLGDRELVVQVHHRLPPVRVGRARPRGNPQLRWGFQDEKFGGLGSKNILGLRV